MNPYPDGPVSVVKFSYLTPLVLQRCINSVKTRHGEDADYLVSEDFRIRYRTDAGAWHDLVVPSGFPTDLASVPRVARAIVDRVGPHLEASIVHDYLYVAWKDIPDRGARKDDWKFADDLFLAGMVEARVPRFRRWIIYRAVRMFGWSVYRS